MSRGCALSFLATCAALLVLASRLFAQLREPAVGVVVDASAARYIARLLQDVPRRVLDAAELEALGRDGLVVLRRLVPEEAVLETVEDAALASHSSFSANLPHPMMFNSAVRALAQHGPFGELAASALGVPAVRFSDSDIWVKEAVESPRATGPWHKDLHNRASAPQPYVTVWLALTDAPDAVEWLLGSHRLPHNCSLSPDRRLLSLGVDQGCMTELWGRGARPGGAGGLAARTFRLQRGDAVLFDGGLWHRGRSGREPRVAVDFRFVPADLRFAGALALDGLYRTMYHRFAPAWCAPLGGPLFPPAHPRGAAEAAEAGPWPVVLTRGDVLAGAWGLSGPAARWALAGYGLPRCDASGAVAFDAEL